MVNLKITSQVVASGTPGPAGKSAYQTAVDNGFVGTESEWLKSLLPFKGWYDSVIELEAVHANPLVGEYAYVKGATSSDPVKIYECSTEGSWSDSGRTVDTSSVQTFRTGEAVNEVDITEDSSEILEDGEKIPTAGAVAGALGNAEFLTGEKVKNVGIDNKPTAGSDNLVKSGGIFNSITSLFKDDFRSEDVVPVFQNKYGIDRQTGFLFYINNVNTNASEIELNGADYILFKGLVLKIGDTSSYGYSFGYYSTPGDSSTWVTLRIGNWDIENIQNNTIKDYLVEVPENATHFRTTSSAYQILTPENFYCRLIYGKPVSVNFGNEKEFGQWEDIDGFTVTQNRYISYSDGTEDINTNLGIVNLIKADVSGCDYIKFPAWCTLSATPYAYGFYDENDSLIRCTRYVYNQSSTRLDDLIVKVPENAKTFKLVQRVASSDKYYLKKWVKIQDSVNDRINDNEDNVNDRINVISESLNTEFRIEKCNYFDVVNNGIKPDNDTIINSTYSYASFNVEGFDKVRFLGFKNNTTPSSVGWCFLDSNDIVVGGGNYGADTSLTERILFEYEVDVPQSAVLFKTNICTPVYLCSQFYCYKIKGSSVGEQIEELKSKIDNNIGISIESIQLSDILRKDLTNYVTGCLDGDEINIHLRINEQSAIVVYVIKNKNGTTDGNANLYTLVKSVDLKWNPDEEFKNITLRFTSSDNSTITLEQVLNSIVESEIICKTNTKKLEPKWNELELPITGLVKNSDGTQIISDSVYTPEQFNFGGFRIIMPSYMNVIWYRGDNPDTFTRYSTLVNGQVIKLETKYSYNNIFRFRFQFEGVSRTILEDDVKNAIQQGKLKILYTPNDKYLSITQRQSHCEPYLRAIQTRLPLNFTPTGRKCYGTHDLPMFVHCTDVHNDIVRLSSAFEYAKYIQADALILTGDYCMRGATNGYGYIKELDDKWNPEGQNATQKIPYLVGTGNHDPWHVTLEEMRSKLIDPFIEKHNYRADSNNLISGVAYYYVDLNIPAPRKNDGYEYGTVYQNTQSVRIIMLDIVDEQAGEISRWGISQTQIDWFIDTLASTQEDTAIFIGLHTSPDTGLSPSDKQAEYAAQVPQTKTLKYVSDMFTYKDFLYYATPHEQLNGTYDFNGSPIVEIIDAYIGKTSGSGSYTYVVGGTTESIPQSSAVTKTVNWSCDFSNAKGTFIAYLCGHTHADMVSYIDNAQYTQLVLCETCTVCEYGPYRNGRGSSNSDCLRGSSGSTQDGFNVYVLDLENRRVGIARIGSNMTVNFEPRTACWISFTSTKVI